MGLFAVLIGVRLVWPAYGVAVCVAGLFLLPMTCDGFAQWHLGDSHNRRRTVLAFCAVGLLSVALSTFLAIWDGYTIYGGYGEGLSEETMTRALPMQAFSAMLFLLATVGRALRICGDGRVSATSSDPSAEVPVPAAATIVVVPQGLMLLAWFFLAIGTLGDVPLKVIPIYGLLAFVAAWTVLTSPSRGTTASETTAPH